MKLADLEDLVFEQCFHLELVLYITYLLFRNFGTMLTLLVIFHFSYLECFVQLSLQFIDMLFMLLVCLATFSTLLHLAVVLAACREWLSSGAQLRAPPLFCRTNFAASLRRFSSMFNSRCVFAKSSKLASNASFVALSSMLALSVLHCAVCQGTICLTGRRAIPL